MGEQFKERQLEKRKFTSSIRDSYRIFGGVAEWRNLLPYCQSIINLLNTMCLFMKLIMNDFLLCI
jgi:hypothetical protein